MNRIAVLSDTPRSQRDARRERVGRIGEAGSRCANAPMSKDAGRPQPSARAGQAHAVERAAPDWVTVTCTIGMLMFGIRVIGSERKLTMPRMIRKKQPTPVGIGERIDQAETLSLILPLPGPRRQPRWSAPRRRFAGRPPRAR